MNEAMQITVTDRLKLEYVKMPTIDTNFRFLYRFKLPFETIWQEGRIGMVDRSKNRYGLGNVESLLKEFAMDRWVKMCSDNMGTEGIPKEAEWLFNMKGADLVECDIQPKERSKDMK